MPLSLYNTLSRETEVFIPVHNDGSAGFYGCGPTVYNYAHIGNLRAYVFHDLLVRTMRRLGYKVTHVMNITDVGHLTGDNDSGDDKMVKSAGERGKSVLEIANFYTEAFFKDIERMNIERPDIVCRATEHIGDMIALIKRIEAGGYTYSAGGNLYFDVSKFPHYHELARLRLDEQKAGARTGVDENKRNPQDFVLWFTKSKFENQALVWDSPWGVGYPGWHIECSAMSIKYLGEQFDIHAGGIDHIPIHHTNEIAQSEAATDIHPWVKYWLHNEFLVLDRGKMSKSEGGFLTLQSIIDEGYEALDYRYLLLGGHYRSQLQFSWPALDSARSSRKALGERIRALAEKAGNIAEITDPASTPSAAQSEKAEHYIGTFIQALEDDINTPRALAELWGVLRDSGIDPRDALLTAFDMDNVLGLGLADTALEASKPVELSAEDAEAAAALSEEVERAITERAVAKKAKDYAKADGIRNALKEKGVILEDTPSGTVWHKA
ncbi:cysteine--tRNA ligase [Spirochaetia bacterium]|nr:cysteine--tRNA ligase [Spirochaetia bacterium]